MTGCAEEKLVDLGAHPLSGENLENVGHSRTRLCETEWEPRLEAEHPSVVALEIFVQLVHHDKRRVALPLCWQ